MLRPRGFPNAVGSFEDRWVESVDLPWATGRQLTALGRDVVDALSDYPVPVLNTSICQRIALAESAAQGQTVFETAPDNPAGKEIQTLIDEIMEVVK